MVQIHKGTLEMITIDKEFEIPKYSEVCNRCKHLTDGLKRICKAFPDGIPKAIWIGENDHTKPYKGDNGIRFKAIKEK